MAVMIKITTSSEKIPIIFFHKIRLCSRFFSHQWLVHNWFFRKFFFGALQKYGPHALHMHDPPFLGLPPSHLKQKVLPYSPASFSMFVDFTLGSISIPLWLIQHKNLGFIASHFQYNFLLIPPKERQSARCWVLIPFAQLPICNSISLSWLKILYFGHDQAWQTWILTNRHW